MNNQPNNLWALLDEMAVSRYCMLRYIPPSYLRLMTSEERALLSDCHENVDLFLKVWFPIKDRIDRIYGTTP